MADIRPVFYDRFWIKVVKTETCWEWCRSLGSHGYGQFSIGRGNFLAHRISWVMAFGAIPEGMWVLHRCDNRVCVRPDHLFLGSHDDNEKDKINKGRHYETKKTHCPKGHVYAGENLYIGKRGDGRKFRQCSACRRLRTANEAGR